MEKILKPTSNSKAARVTFYIFEIAALIVAVIYVIMGLANAINYSAFSAFISGFMSGIINMLILYGIGRVIDLLAAKSEK